MSIASEITRLQGVKSDILTAIGNKGVVVPAGSALDDCPSLISQISSGGEDIYIQPVLTAPDIGIYIVDKNGYICKKVMGKIAPIPWAIVDPNADYSSMGLGSVTLEEVQIFTIGGRDYRCINIGGAIWMLENLDYKFQGCDIGPAGTNITTPSAWYYNNDETTYGEGGNKYGLLYNGYAAKYLNTNRNTLIQGWHVPSSSEISSMINNIGGSSTGGWTIKSRSDWGGYYGTDDFLMDVKPYGYRNGSTGSFSNVGTAGYFLTSTIVSDYIDRARIGTTGAISVSSDSIKNGFSIRLVKDP